jgi:hypothetical protein
MDLSVCRPSPLNDYSFVREENVGSTRKSVEIYLLFMHITNLILAIHMQSVNGMVQAWVDQKHLKRDILRLIYDI